MAGRYGMSFAKDLINQGDYEEAVTVATRSIEDGDDGPEPLFDRATANELLEAYDAAVADFEAAIGKNRAEKVLDPFLLDDAYFSALVAAARRDAGTDVARGVARLERYRATCPDGAHIADARDWQKRLRGELVSLLDKTKDLNVV